jgi:NADH:ubiquinone reductase (H+-translocating)
VSANPLVAGLGQAPEKGRLIVDAQLRVPGLERVWAEVDAAAVPDLTKQATSAGDGNGDGSARRPPPPAFMTAQHAQRQAVTLARNVAASLGWAAPPYRHHDLGLVADLGGRDAVAKVLGVSLAGPTAKAVTRAHHLNALPATPNRVRVAADWLLAAALYRARSSSWPRSSPARRT